MSVDLICPDCGGVIGATGADSRKACTCFTRSSSTTTTTTAPAASKSDTVAMESPVKDLNDRQKVCIVCGKDVTGHRRVKDSRGYMCYSCAKAEQEAERAGTVPCAECNKRVKPGGLVKYAGIMICRSCHNAHKEAGKKAIKKIATRHYEMHEKQTLIWLSVVFVILLCLVIYATIRWKTHYSTRGPGVAPDAVGYAMLVTPDDPHVR